MFWDHPRMCGEHAGYQSAICPVAGSSPHVRGTPPERSRRPGTAGIIPACAGNTGGKRGLAVVNRDHPRMCGEHANSLTAAASAMGSSPHVRGTPVVDRAERSPYGIIPACAGNTPSGGIPGSIGRDHPRMCGEHLLASEPVG